MVNIIRTVFFMTVLLFIMGVLLPLQAAAEPATPDALKVLADKGAQVRYLGQKHGMQGWITIYKGKEQYYYVTPDGKGFVMGLLFNKDGEIETLEQVRALQDKNEGVLDMLVVDDKKQEKAQPEEVNQDFQYKTPAERMFADVENSNWITFGQDDAPVIYTFMDPQCSHCHAFMKDLRKGYLDKGLVQLRVIPVGFREETLAQASLLLASPDPQDRWFRHLDGDATALPVDSTISTQGVQKNLALLQAWKFDVTPLTVYKDKNGKVKIVRGKPSDMNKILAEIKAVSP